ncbi:MAG: hypothetical protein ABIR84_09705 [Candidatus Nitrotoga sp.]
MARSATVSLPRSPGRSFTTYARVSATSAKSGLRRGRRPSLSASAAQRGTTLDYLRVDTIHQGDLDDIKGVYQINGLVCVTQYEGVAACERINVALLIPVLEDLLQSFPFSIFEFHSDK